MIRVRVPATSANLGPGFDALGLAVALYNVFDLEEAEGLVLEGAAPGESGPENLLVRAYRRGLEELGLPWRGLRARFAADIPVARGLGSSAACIVGGLLAAGRAGSGAAGASGAGLPRGRILELAAEIEGHPDNTSPALLGGFAAAVMEGGRVEAVRAPLGGELAFLAMVPPFPLSTAKARAALPKTLPFADAARNSGRAALVAAAFLARDWDRLEAACSDRLHEPYRAPLIPGFEAAVAAARAAGALAVYLSGAGPTVMALGRAGDAALEAGIAAACAAAKPAPWRLYRLAADDQGAVIEPGGGA
ncbi:MAG: homoserine kinase [Spirochaetaceae bacterium]|nr:homoserine kinase [Spirochaetaceae bacterium]